MPNTPCQDECNYLIQLAGRLAGAMPDAGEQLQEWKARAHELLRSPNLESLAGEAELEQLSLLLRTAWLREANRTSSSHLKSPPHFEMVRLPSGEKNPFPYDRWNKPWSLEARAASFRSAPSGWVAEQILFNSGMASIVCLLQVMRHLYQPKAAKPLLLHGVGGYFEIMDLMKDTQDDLLQFRIFQTQREFQQSVAQAEAQLIYIESVYTQAGELYVFDLDGFIRAWQQRNGTTPTTLVLDTTFAGNRFPIKEFLARLCPNKPRVIIQISSMLKLDQEGLEFSNAGLMTIYSESEEIASGVAKRMRKFRATMGLGLTLEQITALDYPGFLDRELSERHAAAVYKNNALLAQRLETGPELLFTGKSHPALRQDTAEPWAIAPFVNVFLRPDTSGYDRELLEHAIHAEVGKRGITFQPGSSFGFRAHRVETSIQSEASIQVIRVAMGCRTGPSLQATIDLLNEFSRLASFENLRGRYPKLAEISRKSFDQR